MHTAFLEGFKKNHDTQGVCFDESITAVDMTPDIKAFKSGFWGMRGDRFIYFGGFLVVGTTPSCVKYSHSQLIQTAFLISPNHTPWEAHGYG